MLSNPDGYLNRFSTGDLRSLSVPGIRDSLLKFHSDWYTANIMTLSFGGKYSLDELEKLAREKFSDVVNKNVVVPSFENPPHFRE